VATLQHLPYFLGISAGTVGSTGLSMHVVIIPPGGKSEPHLISISRSRYAAALATGSVLALLISHEQMCPGED
jgi:hypothetical protein